MGKKGLVDELLLVLLPDPVVSFMILTSCCKSIIFRLSLVGVCANLQSLTRDMILVLRTCTPSLGSCLTSENSSSEVPEVFLSFYGCG